MAVIHPPIPVRYDYSGDKYSAIQLTSIGKGLLAKLSRGMSFEGLPTGTSSITLGDGTTVTAIINYGLHNIEIYAPPVGGGVEVETTSLCMCYPCMTFGIILNVYAGEGFEHYKYDVALCAGLGTLSAFIDFSGITSAGYAKYAVGQYVFVGNLCGSGCLEEGGPTCMMDNASEDPDLLKMTVLPVYNTAEMKPIIETIFTELVNEFS